MFDARNAIAVLAIVGAFTYAIVSALARARVRDVDGSQIWFDVEAHDGAEQVGDGEHLRIVVDEARFARRIEKKAAAIAEGKTR